MLRMRPKHVPNTPISGTFFAKEPFNYKLCMDKSAWWLLEPMTGKTTDPMYMHLQWY